MNIPYSKEIGEEKIQIFSYAKWYKSQVVHKRISASNVPKRVEGFMWTPFKLQWDALPSRAGVAALYSRCWIHTKSGMLQKMKRAASLESWFDQTSPSGSPRNTDSNVPQVTYVTYHINTHLPAFTSNLWFQKLLRFRRQPSDNWNACFNASLANIPPPPNSHVSSQWPLSPPTVSHRRFKHTDGRRRAVPDLWTTSKRFNLGNALSSQLHELSRECL